MNSALCTKLPETSSLGALEPNPRAGPAEERRGLRQSVSGNLRLRLHAVADEVDRCLVPQRVDEPCRRQIRVLANCRRRNRFGQDDNPDIP